MSKTAERANVMQAIIDGLLAVWAGDKGVTLVFDCTGPAPVPMGKNAEGEQTYWSPTVKQARAALHRYIASAVKGQKEASAFPTQCDHAGAVHTAKQKFTPSAATGSVGILAYWMGKIAKEAAWERKRANRVAGLQRAIANGGVWIARGVVDKDGDIRGFPSQRKAAAAYCRAFVGPDWHERKNKDDLKKQAREQCQQVAWLILGDGTTVSTEGGITQDEVTLMAAQEFGFKGKTVKGASAYLRRNQLSE